MSSLFDNLSEELFQILKGSGKTLTLYTAAGSKTYEPKKARRVFADPDKMMVSVIEAGSDSEVKLYLSQNVDLEAVSKLINSLRMIATRYNVLFNVRKFGRELSPKDFAYQATSVTEAPMWGSTKTSYQRIGETKLIVRHCVPVREGVIGSRARNILNMFVETREGERFKFPVVHLSGARAFAQHINQGGKPHDEIGTSIVELAQESSDLAKVSRYIHHARNILDETAINLRPFIKMRINELRSTFVGLARPRAYGRIVEAGLPTSTSMLCESSDGIDAELARLSETLKIDSNHALAKSLTPVALLTLGVNMNENITDMFHGVLTVESADALLEALADEYGYGDDSWLQFGSNVAFTDAAVFEAAQEYLNLTESEYGLFEGDAVTDYAAQWLMARRKQSGAVDAAGNSLDGEGTDDRERGPDGKLITHDTTEMLAKGIGAILNAQFETPDYPERAPQFSKADPTAKYRFYLDLYVAQNKLLNAPTLNYVSTIIDKMAENKALDSAEKTIAMKLIKALEDDLNGGEVDESYYNDPSDGNEADVERTLEHFEGNFSGEGFLMDSDYSEFVDGTLGEIDKEDPVNPQYFIDGIAYQMAQALEDDDIVGYDKSNPFLQQQAEHLFDEKVKPVLEQHGWTIVGKVKEFAEDGDDRPANHGIEVGDFVATDMGAGQVEHIEGDLAVVMFQSGITKTLDVAEIDKINEVSTGPEEAALQEWFDSFDAARVLAPVEESELTELSRGKKDQYFTAAALDRGAAEKAEVENGDEEAGKRREKRDRGLARLLSKSMMDEGTADVYHSVFAQNSDGSWSHYFDADDKEDAADSAREVKQLGDKVMVIKVPKDQANWTEVNPDEFVKNHIASKSAPKTEEVVSEAPAADASFDTWIELDDVEVEVNVEYEFDDNICYINAITSKSTGQDLTDEVPAELVDRLKSEAYEDDAAAYQDALDARDDAADLKWRAAREREDESAGGTGDLSKDLINDVKVGDEEDLDEAAQEELANLLKNAMFRK